MFLLSPAGMSGSNYLRNLIVAAGLCEAPAHPVLRREDWFLHTSDHLKSYVSSLAQHWTAASDGSRSNEIAATGAEILHDFGEALARRAATGNVKPTILKTPSTENLENLEIMFPGAKTIFLIRDGRDTCFSRIKAGYDNSLEDSARLWATRARHMLHHRDRTLKRGTAPPPLWIRYEDAVRTPDAELNRIAAYLERQRDPSVDVNADSLPVFGSSEFGHGETGDFTKVTVARPGDFNPVGRWRSWPRVTRELFHGIAGDVLIELGYVADGSWCTLPDG
ncbi:MAG: sulfotransferase [Pseudomonadota bacterium]